MATQLDVVNDCLAVMGETPLNSLQEQHDYKAAALNRLAAENLRIQTRKGRGWWFNNEDITLTVSPADSRIYLPGDGIGVTLNPQYNFTHRVAKRGRVLYDLKNGTDIWPDGTEFKAKLVRLLDFELVPDSVAAFITTSVVLWFQNEYDGDQTKTRNLAVLLESREQDAGSEHIRETRTNMLDQSLGLSRIRNSIRQLRRY